MNAEEIMTYDPITTNVTARIRDAIEILQTLEIRHLPVVDDRNQLIGIVSDRDLRGAQQPDGRITEIMNSDVVALGPETDLEAAIDLMLENKVGALPVIDQGTRELLGILSYVDILRAVRNEVR